MDRKHVLQQIISDFSLIKREMMVHGHSNQMADGLTYAELAVIRMINEQDGFGVKDIATKMCVSSSAITQIVNKLITKGLLKRDDDLKDRRHLNISLTSEMKRKFKKIMDSQFSRLEEIFNVLNDDELENLLTISDKITLNIKNNK